LIERVRTAGVRADFLDDGPIPAGPALVVADGAASMMPRIREIARAAIAGGGPLRLILLERVGSRNTGWLYDLLGDPWVGDEFSPYAFEVASTVATPGGETARRIFEAALAAWSAELGVPVPALDPKPFTMRPPHQDWHLPGYLWMAARESYRTSPAAALRLRMRTLTRREPSPPPAGLAAALHMAIDAEDPAVIEGRLLAMSRDDLLMAGGLLPSDRPKLAPLAVAVASRLRGLVHASAGAPFDRARALRNLARRFSDLDRPEDAVECAGEAVSIYRALGAGYERHLAGALIRLGANLRALKKPSFEATREAVDASRALDQESRARALSHHGDSLDAAGEWKPAHDAYREAIEILKPLFPHLTNRAMVLLPATIDDYKRACRNLHRPPDSALIGSLEEFYAR
jgi:tetratricopeptide (TPR) repeat protein